MAEYTKCEIRANTPYNEFSELYDKYDILYHKTANYRPGTHKIDIYKAPENLSPLELANIIDGFFWDVRAEGRTLYCDFD